MLRPNARARSTPTASTCPHALGPHPQQEGQAGFLATSLALPHLLYLRHSMRRRRRPSRGLWVAPHHLQCGPMCRRRRLMSRYLHPHRRRQPHPRRHCPQGGQGGHLCRGSQRRGHIPLQTIASRRITISVGRRIRSSGMIAVRMRGRQVFLTRTACGRCGSSSASSSSRSSKWRLRQSGARQ